MLHTSKIKFNKLHVDQQIITKEDMIATTKNHLKFALLPRCDHEAQLLLVAYNWYVRGRFVSLGSLHLFGLLFCKFCYCSLLVMIISLNMLQCSPFHYHDFNNNSPYGLVNNSYDVSLETLVFDQPIIPLLIFFFNPITCLIDSVNMVRRNSILIAHRS